MKIKLFSLGFLIALVLGVFPIQNVSALSCVRPFPVVGIINNISVKESHTEITLDKILYIQ